MLPEPGQGLNEAAVVLRRDHSLACGPLVESAQDARRSVSRVVLICQDPGQTIVVGYMRGDMECNKAYTSVNHMKQFLRRAFSSSCAIGR